MKIIKSKRQLAQLLIEAGVTQFPKGANWAAQDSDDNTAYMHREKPNRPARWSRFSGRAAIPGSGTPLPTLIPNWHQTVLSRDEFDQIVAETAVQGKPDADGWIEWRGGEWSPVAKDVAVDVKMKNGTEHYGQLLSDACWHESWGSASIIAYRLHKPDLAKSTAVGDDETNLAAKGELEALELTQKPTLDQLLQDWRGADDYAKRKQAEADEAAAMRDEKWQAVQDRAGEFCVIVEMRKETATKLELAITDWRDLRAGDEVWWSGDKIYQPGEYVVLAIEHPSYEGWSTILLNVEGDRVWANTDDDEWRFIRRP